MRSILLAAVLLLNLSSFRDASPGLVLAFSSPLFLRVSHLSQKIQNDEKSVRSCPPSRIDSARTMACRPKKSFLYALPTVVSSLLTAKRAFPLSIFALTMVAFLQRRRKLIRFFYPNLVADPAFAEPLPEANLGCPFVGKVNAVFGSKTFGIGDFYLRTSRKLKGSKKLWMYYFLGTPVAVLAGMQALKDMLNSEFEPTGVSSMSAAGRERIKARKRPTIIGPESLLAEGNKERHSQLRRLVGQALTPTAVAKSIPSLQMAAMEQARKLQQSTGSARMEDYCMEYTLDVAWRQILGLKLSEDEIPAFRQTVYDWLIGVTSPQGSTGMGIGVKHTKGYRARLIIEDTIRKRIRELEINGPDDSTLSGMVFAMDEEGNGKKLTEAEVIDNAMLLIVAGSETASTTMTNAMLFMGLHPNVWKKLVAEQKNVEQKHGTVLTKEALESKVSPYLDAIVKETMRIRPVPSGLPRRNLSTKIIDGKQIPKGWLFDWNILLTHQLDPVSYQEDGSHMDIRKGFVPERWLNEETTPVEYMPLGAGPRYCLGASLAVAEMKIFLATVARTLDFELAGATAKEKLFWKRLSFVPKERNGVLVKVSQRIHTAIVKETA